MTGTPSVLNALLFSADPGSHSSIKLHLYQTELASDALLGKNTIVCSGTGTGKTFVAMHVIEKHLRAGKEGKCQKLEICANVHQILNL